MSPFHRREFLKSATILGSALAVPSSPNWSFGRVTSDRVRTNRIFVSTFSLDVTPPIGHSCCGGWITPVESVSDSLEAIGVVLSGDIDPIVLCAVDWTGILNETHLRFRQAIAEAVDTSPERVAIHCVHQHNAPFACLDAQEIVSQHDDLPPIVDAEFVVDTINRLAVAAHDSLNHAQEVDRIRIGSATVDRVASNRRIVDEAGNLTHWRGSSTRSEELQALPEGLIDPQVKSIVFANGESNVCALHYYATHPMSFYGDGIVSSDFTGLARKRLQDGDSCRHIYFTGCSGNVAAGKYNNGSPEARTQLTDRLFDGMSRSYSDLRSQPVESVEWRHRDLLPTPRSSIDELALLEQIADRSRRVVDRNRPAYQVAWLQRTRAQLPIILSSLKIGDVAIGHLPAESFIEYQLACQEFDPNKFVATAAYGDGGPWYIPVEEAYPQGGYEVSVAFCEPEVDPLMRSGLEELFLD